MADTSLRAIWLNVYFANVKDGHAAAVAAANDAVEKCRNIE